MKILHEEYLKVMKIYVSEDGRKFYSERECQNYEDSLQMKKVKTKDFDSLYPFFSTFFYVDSLGTLELLKRCQFGGLGKTVNNNFIKVGDWVAVKCEYNSDGSDEYDLITVDEIWKGLVDFFNDVEFGDENV